MTLANEVAQWAVLVVLGVLCLGLARQLGTFLVPPQAQLLLKGPRIGKHLPRSLLDATEREHLSALVEASSTGLGIVVALSENCSHCGELVEDASLAGTGPVPAAVVIERPSAPYLERLSGIFPMALADPTGTRLDGAGISATPYLVLVDTDLIVRDRAFATSVGTQGAEWLHRHGDADQDQASMAQVDSAENEMPHPYDTAATGGPR